MALGSGQRHAFNTLSLSMGVQPFPSTTNESVGHVSTGAQTSGKFTKSSLESKSSGSVGSGQSWGVMGAALRSLEMVGIMEGSIETVGDTDGS